MATKKDNTPITQKKPCFDCGEPADCFGWEPVHMIYCKKCSPYQKRKVRFKVLEELRVEGLDVGIWGR